jgi:hypothetical protein
MGLNAWCNTPKDEHSFRLMVSLFASRNAYLSVKDLNSKGRQFQQPSCSDTQHRCKFLSKKKYSLHVSCETCEFFVSIYTEE